MISTLSLFNYYRRYKWRATDFDVMQAQLLGYPQTVLAAMVQYGVLQGGTYTSAASLNVTYAAFTAINVDGKLLVGAGGVIAVTNSVKSLIVARPTTSNANPITRPTAPFDTVYLNSVQGCEVVAIAGDASNYPAKAAGDVILFGVTASGGSVTASDLSQCEFIGKNSNLGTLSRWNVLVGNHQQCHYKTLALAAVALSANDRVRVLDSEAIAASITISASGIIVDCDGGVVFSKSGSPTAGVIISGSRCRFQGGKFSGFSTAGDKALNLTGNYNVVIGTLFATNDTDVNDNTGTNSTAGVISE